MGLIAEISVDAAELYVARFCATTTRLGLHVAARRYRPLLDMAQIEWRPTKRALDILVMNREPLEQLTGAHFGLIQGNASGFGQLFVWFPPRTQPSGDEARLLVRAGVQLKFVPQNIGVYNRGVSKYN